MAFGTSTISNEGIRWRKGNQHKVAEHVEGESTNLKITRPGDLKLATAYVQMTEQKETAALGRKRLFKDEDE